MHCSTPHTQKVHISLSPETVMYLKYNLSTPRTNQIHTCTQLFEMLFTFIFISSTSHHLIYLASLQLSCHFTFSHHHFVIVTRWITCTVQAESFSSIAASLIRRALQKFPAGPSLPADHINSGQKATAICTAHQVRLLTGFKDQLHSELR